MCPGTGADAISKHASMRASFTTLATAIALWLAPQFALAAEDVEAQLRQLRQVPELLELDARLAGIQQQIETVEDDLEAASARLGRQAQILEAAGLEPRQAGSGLSGFLSETQFSGHLAASYNYNFNGIESSASIAGGGRNGAGNLGLTAPFHAQGNNFQLDQLWLELLKPATAESRGGWAFTLAWGESADVMNGNGAFDDDAGDFELALQTPYIHRAYVEYLADVGSGVKLRLGRFGTPVGAEAFSAADNFNISRGLLWSLQPVDHSGLEISGACDNGIDWSLAVSNDFSETNLDSDQGKTFVGHLGYSTETWSASLNGVYGGNLSNTIYAYGGTAGVSGPGSDKDAVALLDLVLTYDPSERLSMWFNFDYFWSDEPDSLPGPSSLTVWGLAAGSLYAISDQTRISLRAEYVYFNDGGIVFLASEFAPDGLHTSRDASVWSITGTIHHALTEQLTLRLEGRYDRGSGQGTPDKLFVTNGTAPGDPDRFGEHDQGLALIQLIYRF